MNPKGNTNVQTLKRQTKSNVVPFGDALKDTCPPKRRLPPCEVIVLAPRKPAAPPVDSRARASAAARAKIIDWLFAQAAASDWALAAGRELAALEAGSP